VRCEISAAFWRTPMAMVRFVTDSHGPKDDVFQLGETIVLGRTSPSQVLLPDASVSREHARIISTPEGYFIEDLNSTNGTSLNGETIRRARLHDGDVIRIQDFALEFVEDTEAKPASRRGDDGLAAAHSGTLVATRSYEDIIGSLDGGDPVGALQQRLQVVYGVSRSAVGSFSLQSLSEMILDELFRIFEQADCGFVLVKEPAKEELAISACRKRDPSCEEFVPSKTIIEHACRDRQAVLSASALDDSRFQAAQSIVASSTTSVICAPVIAEDSVLAVIYIATRRPGRSFREDDLQLVVCVAATLAIALRNARLHQEAVQAQRMAAIGQAVSRLAHCIKNILNGIQGGSYIVDLGIGAEDISKVVKGWEITKRNNQFLSNLVLDMLSFGKTRKPNYESTDINELVQTIVDLNVEKASKQGTAIRCEFDQALLEAEVDAVAIYRCVLNLVSNAIDACDGNADAAVCVRTISPDDAGVFTVQIEDTGSGMTQEVKDSLFQDFFSTKGAKGTGLGLPVVKKCIEEHGGVVEVTSEVNVGSTFAIRLPVAPPGPTTSADAS